MAFCRRIAFFSPVPGSGASTLASLFAGYLSRRGDLDVSLVNCDILYPDRQYVGVEALEGPVNVFLPSIDRRRCILCKACAKACAFQAIRIEKSIGWITLETDKCRACGACLNTCRYNAIGEQIRSVGIWRIRKVGKHLTVIKGKLQAEEFFTVQVIQQIKAKVPQAGVSVYDSYSGVNYPALESLHGADLVFLVLDPALAEPAFLARVTGLLSGYNHRMAAVINKAGPDTGGLSGFLEERNIPLVTTIPWFEFPDEVLGGDTESLRGNLEALLHFVERQCE